MAGTAESLYSDIWPKLERVFSPAMALWSPEEREAEPGTMEKLITYLITYYENTGVARNAIRQFCGIDGTNFSGLNEVRVSTVRDIENTIREAGGQADTWELSYTIKDFLQNTWDFLSTLNLDEAKVEAKANDLTNYVKQLGGESWKKTEASPFRPINGIFDRKKNRQTGEPVLPDCAIEYLKFLWKHTANPPYEFYAERVLTRLGILTAEDGLGEKYNKYLSLINKTQPIKRHRLIVSLGKIVCTDKPRCGVCPIAAQCAFNKANLPVVAMAS